MNYRTFAENVDEALKIAKGYAAELAKEPEEDHEERAVMKLWIEYNFDLVVQESSVKETTQQ